MAASISLAHLFAVSGYAQAQIPATETALLDGAEWVRFTANGRMVTMHSNRWDDFRLLVAVADSREVLACATYNGLAELQTALRKAAAAAVAYLEA